MNATAVPTVAGSPATAAQLVDVSKLVAAYYTERPDPSVAAERVAFGTSGHRGSSFDRAFNEWHILTITQAICDWRLTRSIDGPLFIGRDTHALSEPAFETALEVLAANGIVTLVAGDERLTPTPAVSHAILTWNRGRNRGFADGIVVTPSHNPPEDGGFKYNPPHGGPTEEATTTWIEARANDLLAAGLAGVRRMPFERARHAATTRVHPFRESYVNDLAHVVDLRAVQQSGLRLGVDPLGGAGVHYWPAIADRHGLNLTIVNDAVDPTFAFMTLDIDGRIRMDPSSPYAMQRLIGQKDRFDIAFACDTDHDRHGIVTPGAGLLPPNHYLTVCTDYLFRHRPQWARHVGVGKTVVSSSTIDRVASTLGRRVVEVPVGFKWFVRDILAGRVGFAGEESAGATFLRLDGGAWTTDKDGIVAALLAAEMTARTRRDPGEIYCDLTGAVGNPAYARIDIPISISERHALQSLSPRDVEGQYVAGEPIQYALTTAPGNHERIGGIKAITASGWFAARPSGTEPLCRTYAEHFCGRAHLERVEADAQQIIRRRLAKRDEA